MMITYIYWALVFFSGYCGFGDVGRSAESLEAWLYSNSRHTIRRSACLFLSL